MGRSCRKEEAVHPIIIYLRYHAIKEATQKGVTGPFCILDANVDPRVSAPQPCIDLEGNMYITCKNPGSGPVRFISEARRCLLSPYLAWLSRCTRNPGFDDDNHSDRAARPHGDSCSGVAERIPGCAYTADRGSGKANLECQECMQICQVESSIRPHGTTTT